MGRILAIDYGSKRTGIAVTDELKLIASGLTTVQTIDLHNFLNDYLSKEKVDLIIVGLPKQKDNSFSSIEPEILKFISDFKQNHPEMEVKRIDERFTSKLAFKTMIDSGVKKKDRQNKAMIDEISATIILQSYLYYQ